MAERSETKSSAESTAAGPELRLLDRRAFVGFPKLELQPGVVITDFGLQIPDVSFPFNVTGGASKYQRKKLQFGFLELTVSADVITRKLTEIAGRTGELADVKLHFRPGYLEGQARLVAADRAPLTFKLAFDGDGDRLAIYLYDVRFYAFSTTPAAQVPVLLTRALKELELLPEVELRGASGFTSAVLPPLVQHAAVGRGYKLPSLDSARLAAAEVSTQGLKLRFATGGLPPPATPDEELLLALEGARAFADAELLLAEGKLAEAREAYLKAGDITDAHPFAAERLLQLLVADPQAHELALDLAASLARRREKSATAIWAEAVVRERRGEHARAAERFLALVTLSRKQQEEAGAFFAAEAAARAARDQAPNMAVRALHELLGLRPDHLPSLKALARASDQSNDRAGAIRAYRRIAALARDPFEAAEAHVHLARLCALTEDDIAGARLHCEAALKLHPDHPDALYQLGELCHRAGEHLRAIKALDRLREVALGRHEVDRVGKANLLAGKVWESGLNQPENALLRYREAVSLLPGDPEPLFLSARVAESLGRVQESIAGYQQAIELAGPSPQHETIRTVAHASQHAMARLYRTRLADPVKAREALEAALALDPRDTHALEELIPAFRAAGRTVELADALEKAAVVATDSRQRAALWAEAGELYRARLGKADKAEKLLQSALEADGDNRIALEGMLALAESRRDGPVLCRCLKALAELTGDVKERSRYLRRLAVAARDLAFDLELSAYALIELLKLEPEDLSALGELCALQRRRSDMNGLALALEQRAAAAEKNNDKRLAASSLRELSQVYETRLGRMGDALVALERAARFAPESTILFELADLSLRCDRPQHARRALEDVLATLPAHAAPERMAEVRGRLGRACELLGDKDAAKEHYARAFPMRRLDEELAARLEALYVEAGQTRELVELWSARAEALLTHDRASSAAPLYLKSARALLQLGDRVAASARLAAALDAAPDGPEAADILDTMASLELERGGKVEAAKLLARKASLIEVPREAAKLLFRASQLASGTAREEAFLNQALQKDGTFSPARLRRAELVALSQPAVALEDYEVALASAATDADAPSDDERLLLLRRAASAALKAERVDAARRYLAQYSARRQDDLGALKELAQLHRKASAREPLCDLLGELWPRLSGNEQKDALREYAQLSLELSRRAAAIEALRGLLELDANDAWAAKTLLPLLPDDASAAERLSLLTRVLAQLKGGERTDLLIQRAKLHRDAGRRGPARDDLLEAAQHSARPAGLYRALAELAQESRDGAAELSAWQKAVESDSALGELALPRLLALSRERLAASDAQLARAGFLAATTLAQDDQSRQAAFKGLADAAIASGDVTTAAAALLDATKGATAQEQVELHLRRAALLEDTGDLDGAAFSLEAALSLSPRHSKATASFKRILSAQGNWAALAEILAGEAARTPKDKAAPLFEELGRIYQDKLSEPGPAEAAFRRAAQLDSKNVYVRKQLVELAAARGDLGSAVKLMEEAALNLPTQDGAALLREGVELAFDEGDETLALRLARKAHKLASAAGEDLRTLATLLYARGAVSEAIPLFVPLARSVDWKDRPDEAEETLLAFADLAEQVGDLKNARLALEQVLKERPWSTLAARRLSVLLAKTDPRAAIQVLWTQANQLAPSAALVSSLLALAERARAELADLDLASTIAAKAAELSDAPLAVHRYLASMYRESGRTGELMAELLRIASSCVESGDVEGAISAYEEEATLAETVGRVDDALQSLVAIRQLCEDEGEEVRAAVYERRRAELLRDAKLDLDGAEASLQKSFELHKSLETALLGMSLSRRREDHAAEADWVERSIDLRRSPEDRARALLELARLFENRLNARSQAEAAAREALKSDPAFRAAEDFLASLLEKDGRLGDLAQMYEDAAEREADPRAKSDLYRRAAALYADRANRPDAAAAALLAARAASPDDLELTAEIADRLHQLGRAYDAADFDALLLERDPFHERIFTRHVQLLEKTKDLEALAALHVRRGEAQQGEQAAESFLLAAEAFRSAGAEERARICEDQAFDRAPESDAAFNLLRERRKGDVRKLAEVLFARAKAVSSDSVALLRERAQLLQDAGEALLAAAAWDELLAAAPDDLEALAIRAELAAAAGGARAAQPYDRRLIQLGGDSLAPAVIAKTQLRLGHAALAGGAFSDATTALEAVVSLDPSGERGREALSLLAEVHARTRNAPGLFKTTLLLAKDARTDEAEALYRRAADLFDDPTEAVDALVPLARMRPADASIVDRAVEGLKSLGRYEEVLELSEKSAEALGGAPAATRLLQAAELADTALHDAARAHALKVRAGSLDPDNTVALRAVIEDARARGDEPGLVKSLERYESLLLRDLNRSQDELSAVQLELAKLLIARGGAAELNSARMRLDALVQAGPSSAGYASALELLEKVIDGAAEPLALGKVFAARAELASGEARAALLLSAAESFSAGGEAQQALTLVRASLAAQQTAKGHALAASLWESSGQRTRAAQSWASAAKLLTGPDQGEALLKAADLYEAADERVEARELVEQLAAEFPALMSPVELGKRFARLGATDLALMHGFAPAMAAGEYDKALELAEAANDPHRVREVLWAAAVTKDGAAAAERLAGELSESAAWDDLYKLAQKLEQAQPALSTALYERVCFGPEGEPEQLLALSRLLELGRGPDVIGRSVARISDKTPIPLLELLVEKARELGGAVLDDALTRAAPFLPWRKAALARELFELRRRGDNVTGALEALQAVLSAEEDLRARAALLIEQGELQLRGLNDEDAARESFELALTCDLDSLAAVRHLVDLYAKARAWDRLVAMAERLQRMAGERAVTAHEPLLVDAYEALGRKSEAYRILSRLGDAEDVLRRRAKLAEEVGLYGEALALRERLTTDASELEDILKGYVKANLLPFAVRLGEALLARGTLKMETRTLLAERLSPTQEGAALASKLWLELLPNRLVDADAWTLFAEALRLNGRAAAANLVDGFGAALAGSAQIAQTPVLSPLSSLGSLDGAPELPEGAVEISPKNMPRLHATLSEALSGLKLRGRDLYLDPKGGAVAYVADGGALVLGVGALAAFGPSELSYLLALAWALGADGKRMFQASDSSAWADEAAEAFAAAPTSLGAARVVALLDPTVLGDDPLTVDVPGVLKHSAAFRALAKKALALPMYV